MNKTLLFIFIIIGCFAQAQENTRHSRPEILFDSLFTHSSRQWLRDSLSIVAWGDSVSHRLGQKNDSTLIGFQSKMDSLRNLKLPVGRLQVKIDSINQNKEQLLAVVNDKQKELFSRSRQKLTEWQASVKSKMGVNMTDVNSGIVDLGSKPVGELSLAVGNEIDLLDLKSVSAPGLSNILPKGLDLPSLNAGDFNGLELPNELKDINQSLPFSSADGLKEWQDKISEVAGVPALNDLPGNPDKIIEGAVSNISQVSEAQKVIQGSTLESPYADVLKNVKDPDAVRKSLAMEAIKEAKKHFAGKEQALQTAMAKVSKYKESYSSVSSLSDIKKLKPHSLKGKPVAERIVPGISFQIHSKRYLNFDFNPYLAFKMTDKILTGLGWNQRLAVDWSQKKIISQGAVYGSRIFAEYKLQKGFSIRLEEEAINSFVPALSLGSGEGKREWIFTTMTGLKKDYRFFKNVRGFTLVQVDVVKLFKPGGYSAYGNVVNARIGFEFKLKKRKK